MSLKDKLKEIVQGLMLLEEQLPEGEGMESEVSLPGEEVECEGSECESEEDPLMEHMKQSLGRNNNAGMASKPMFGGKPEAMPMKKPEMPMQKRFGK